MKVGTVISPNEVLELHELVTFKNVCVTKAATMSSLVKDEELKSILQQDFTTGKEHIKELSDLMVNSSTAFSTSSKATVV